MKTTICAIIKNEHNYLKEWIDWHLSLGFTTIHLFEDKDSESHEGIVSDYKKVFLRSYNKDTELRTILSCQGNSHRQFVLYSWFCEQYKDKYDWVAFIDIDEFIFLEDNYSLDRLCNDFSNHSAVLLYWKMMGASGYIKQPSCGVTEAYTSEVGFLKCDIGWYYKSLVNLKEYRGLKNLHYANNAVKTNYENTDNNNFMTICYDKVWINHYFTKSWEEWCYRIFKRGGTLNGHRTLGQFFEINTDMEHLRKKLISEVAHIRPVGTYWVDKKNLIIAGGNIHDIKTLNFRQKF